MGNNKRLTWEEIEKLEPDSEPLSAEELEQLSDSDSGERDYVPLEQVKRELGL